MGIVRSYRWASRSGRSCRERGADSRGRSGRRAGMPSAAAIEAHPTAVALAAAEHRPAAAACGRPPERGAERPDRVLRLIGRPPPGLHVGEVEPQRRDPLVRDGVAEPHDERVVHPRTGAMADDEGGSVGGMPDRAHLALGRRIVNRSMRAIMVADGRSLLPRDVGLSPTTSGATASSTPRASRRTTCSTTTPRSLTSVEVNYTFRRLPSEKTIERWRERARPGFVFTLKANQRITHWKRLEDVEEDVRGIRDDGQAPRRPLRMRAVPMPAEPALRRGPAREVPRHASRRTARPTRWSSGIRRGRRRAMPCSSAASPGASPRPTTRTRSPRICRGSRSATCGCGRPSTRTKSSRRGRGGSDRPWMPVAPSSPISSTRTRARQSEDGEAARGDAACSGGEPSGRPVRDDT